MIDIAYPPEAEAFRARLREILSRTLAADWAGIGALPEAKRESFVAEWRKVLVREELLAVSWPREYGGAGLSDIEQVVLAEEFQRTGVPDGTENDTLGIKLLGNTLIALGTEAQKRRHLPRILSGEEVWCQGFSEPDAGSDLASVRTTAELRDGQWIVNGQKIWTSEGHRANWIFTLVRTDRDASKHGGLSFLLIPMNQPGVEVRPILNAAGYGSFSEVFFNDAVTAEENIIGLPGEGWGVATTLLSFERGVRVTTDSIRFGLEIAQLIELAVANGKHRDPHIRAELAWCYAQVQIMRFRGYRALTKLLGGRPMGVDSSLSKVRWSEFFRRYTTLAMQILGRDGLVPAGQGTGGALSVAPPGSPNSSKRWVDEFLYGRAATIYGGSSEIQRNIISERVLGMPREKTVQRASAGAPTAATVGTGTP